MKRKVAKKKDGRSKNGRDPLPEMERKIAIGCYQKHQTIIDLYGSIGAARRVCLDLMNKDIEKRSKK